MWRPTSGVAKTPATRSLVNGRPKQVVEASSDDGESEGALGRARATRTPARNCSAYLLCIMMREARP